MRFLLHWLVMLALIAICFVPGFLGMQFKHYPEYMFLTLLCAVAAIAVMRFMHKAAPLGRVGSDTEKEFE